MIALNGTPGIDLKLRSLGAAGLYGLTPWTEAGAKFIETHVLTLEGASRGDDCVWFSERDASAVKEAFHRSGLAMVAGTGAEPEPKHDMHDFW